MNAPVRPGAPDLFGMLHRRQALLRTLFWAYAILLFLGTHWPRFTVSIPGVERPDLFVHFGLFGTWFVLFWLTGYSGPIDRVRTVLVSALAACGYAGIDERLQAIPWIQRNCAWDDLEANWLGIALAMLAALVCVGVFRRSVPDTLRS